MPENSNATLAPNLQHQFDSYLLGLTFTLLGLAVQTAGPVRNPIASSFEIIGWAALLISGLVGLQRARHMPQVYRLMWERETEQRLYNEARKAQLHGTQTIMTIEDGTLKPIEQVLQTYTGNLQSLDAAIAPFMGKDGMAVRWHRWQMRTFVGGMALLIIARAYVPVGQIILAFRDALGR